LEANARFTLPPARPGTNRMLYVFEGQGATVGGRAVANRSGVRLRPDVAVEIVNGAAFGEALLLQGRPIGEPVVQHGPFVMNTPTEIHEAFADYRRTRFGGWPWPSEDPTHGAGEGRFARHADGHVERPG
jgi:hypothetical protein